MVPSPVNPKPKAPTSRRLVVRPHPAIRPRGRLPGWRLALGWLFLPVMAWSVRAAALREYDVLRAFPPGRLDALSAGDLPDAQGLTGGNRSVGRWIEAGAQRGSCRAVIAAVVAGDLERADRAWRGIEVAFEHQREDGGFTAAARPNGGSSATGPAAVETAYFFLQELGRAILVIRQSPHAAHFEPRLAALEPRLRRACAFLAAGEATILPKSRKAVNRVFIAAKAFGTCGLALHDDALVAAARRLVAEALKQRDADGVFLEHGGRDSSYNAVSLLFAQVLALHVPLPELDEALVRAARWQVSRILVSGEVDHRGNTRTGVGREPGYNGQPKGINYHEVALALTLHGLVHTNAAAREAADRVMGWIQRESRRTAWQGGTNRVTLDGRARMVLLDLPPERRPGAPLLLVFHGFTSSAAEIRETTGFAPLATRAGWVVAHPEGTRDAQGRRFFQVGYDFHRQETVNEVAALQELAGRLVRDLDLDPRAVFATGFSNGADLAYYLAAQPHPWLAAIAPVGGTLMSAWGRPLQPAPGLSVLAVNAVDDPTTRWAGDPDNRDGWGAYLGAPEVHRIWSARLDRREIRPAEGGGRVHRAWSESTPTEVLLQELPTGGHRWPASLGGRATAEEILAFFERHRAASPGGAAGGRP